MLEAKALGGKIDLASSAAVSYAWELVRAQTPPQLVGVTDGVRWVLAEPHSLKSPRLVVDLAKKQTRPETLALELAQVLWRRLWENGQPPPPPNGSQWVVLPAFSGTRGSRPPKRIHFPDGEEVELAYWKDIVVVTAEWLVRKGLLTPDRCPILKTPKSALVHSEPVYPAGKPIKSFHVLSNGLYLDSHGSAPAVIQRARKLLSHCGVDPQAVSLLPR
ncbi:MAG: type I restriction endonuclease subunit R [Thermomicrobium sp.]|nr:type I restriction endonuclease subunit R [Thermomicrobium sp.]